MRMSGDCPSSDTENIPWFVDVHPYTEMALPSKMMEADALAALVRLCT